MSVVTTCSSCQNRSLTPSQIKINQDLAEIAKTGKLLRWVNKLSFSENDKTLIKTAKYAALFICGSLGIVVGVPALGVLYVIDRTLSLCERRTIHRIQQPQFDRLQTERN